jgi:antirestriction protein ArdC
MVLQREAWLSTSAAPRDRADCGEELMAEIASAFFSAELGVTQDTRADHAQRA